MHVGHINLAGHDQGGRGQLAETAHDTRRVLHHSPRAEIAWMSAKVCGDKGASLIYRRGKDVGVANSLFQPPL